MGLEKNQVIIKLLFFKSNTLLVHYIFLIIFLEFCDRVLLSPGWPRACCVAKDDLETYSPPAATSKDIGKQVCIPRLIH